MTPAVEVRQTRDERADQWLELWVLSQQMRNLLAPPPDPTFAFDSEREVPAGDAA